MKGNVSTAHRRPHEAVAPCLFPAEEASGERTNRTWYQVGLERGGGGVTGVSHRSRGAAPQPKGLGLRLEWGLGGGGAKPSSRAATQPRGFLRARGASHLFPVYIHLRLCSGSKRALFRDWLLQSRRRYILK